MIVKAMSENRLTPKQQGFVNAYATNGQNGTAAAREAGYSGSENVLAATASRMLRLGKIQKALAAIVGKAIAKAERGAVADLAEVLEYQTTVMRSKAADYFDDEGQLDMERVREAPAGLVRKIRMHSVTQTFGKVETTSVTHELETESALAASQALLRHYDGLDKPRDAAPTINILAILSELPTGTLRDLKAAVVKVLPEKAS